MGCNQEAVVLLWKLIDENSKFVPDVGTRDENALVVPLLYYWCARGRLWRGVVPPSLECSFTGRHSKARVAMVHVCTFVLLVCRELVSVFPLNKARSNRHYPEIVISVFF